MKKHIVTALALFFVAQLVYGQMNPVAVPDSARMAWFNKAKFGIFMHWGVYSGSTTESWPFFNGEISLENYIANGKKFTADKFNPDKWADLFVRSGAKYVVLTAQHCDGVALWNTKFSKNTIRNLTPCKKDLVAEYTKSMQKAGLKTGLYYAHNDWSSPDYMMLTQGLSNEELKEKQKIKYAYSKAWNERNKNGTNFGRKFTPEEKVVWERYLKVHDGQILELLSNYGKIDLLWFDYMHPNGGSFVWNEKGLKEQMLAINPGLVVNARLGDSGDYHTAERGLPVLAPLGSWEYCETLSDRWGYLPNDTNYKSSYELVRILVECISMGGNFLLDIGPKPDGTFDPEHEKRLLEIGAWIKKHEEAVYETQRGLLPGHFWGPTALSPDKTTLFLYLLDEPQNAIQVKGIRNQVKQITVVGHPETELPNKRFGGAPWANIPGAISFVVPRNLFDDKVTVVKIEFNEPINLYREKGRDIVVN